MELDKERDKAPPPKESEAFENMLKSQQLHAAQNQGKLIQGLKPPVLDVGTTRYIHVGRRNMLASVKYIILVKVSLSYCVSSKR